MAPKVTIRIQVGDFDVAAETVALTNARNDIGAVVNFIGICRSGEGEAAIAAMTLEHYPGMAEDEMSRQAEDALSRWPLTGLTMIHRVGRLLPGDNIMMVMTASAHRAAAFEAAQFLMDYLKTAAPFWKHEEKASGSSWVDARADDDVAAARWVKS